MLLKWAKLHKHTKNNAENSIIFGFLHAGTQQIVIINIHDKLCKIYDDIDEIITRKNYILVFTLAAIMNALFSIHIPPS